jgi:sugar-specific transcriptional regulator TrmB/DNA-binding CsgD family transcriptional regulator
MLTVLGVTSEEAVVYQHLAGVVAGSPAEIEAATDLPAAAVATAIGSLLERGLVSRSADTAEEYVAAPPGVLERMIEDRVRDLRAAQETLDVLAAKRRTAEASDAFEVIRGREVLRHVLMDLFDGARDEVLNLAKPPSTIMRSEDRVSPAPGVKRRTVFETEVIAMPETLEAVREGLRSGEEARVHTRLPIKLLIFDGSVAVVPMHHDSAPLGVVIRESAMLDALLALFDFVWAAAVPLQLDNEHSPVPRDPFLSVDERQLLSLLLAGLTDEAIAVHHHTSARTVQRKVQALMTRAQVRTRMQLAWEASRRGWI